MEDKSKTQEAALDYFRLGWSVIRTKPGAKEAYGIWKKFQVERASEQNLRDWFKNPNLGVAVVFGRVSAIEGSELVCRDFDSLGAYHFWAKAEPGLASALPTVATGREGGGRHVYCLSSAENVQATRAALGKPTSVGAIEVNGGELRIGRAYCVLPPSKHPGGGNYQWLIEPTIENLLEIDLNSSGFFSLHTSDTSNASYTSNSSNPSDSIHRDVATSSAENSDPLQERIRTVIRSTQPERIGRRETKIWRLVLAFKTLPEVADMPALKLIPYVKEWHAMAVDTISTKPFADTARDFIHAWDNYIPERASLSNVKARADEQPPPEFDDYGISGLRQVASLCRELQRREGPLGCFFLSCRILAQLYGVTHKTASSWLSLLTTLGVLEEVSKGSLRSRQASEYRYLGEL